MQMEVLAINIESTLYLAQKRRRILMYFLKQAESTSVHHQCPSSQGCSFRQCFIPDDNNSKLQSIFLGSENSSKSSA